MSASSRTRADNDQRNQRPLADATAAGETPATSLVDVHCHLDSPRFELSVSDLVDQARAAGVGAIVMAGTDPESWQRQAGLAARHPEVYPVYGVHPWAAATLDGATMQDWLTELECWIRAPGADADADGGRAADVGPGSGGGPAADGGPGAGRRAAAVAVGETGLDGSKRARPESLDLQEASLRAHLEIARRAELPVVLHVVKAHERALRVLRDAGIGPAGGFVHSFSGSAELVAEYVRLGLHISLSGSVARPQSRRLRRAAASIPGARLLIETDAPDQPPHPHAAELNRPALLPLIARAVAQARGTTPEALAALTTTNARRLLGLV